MGVPQPADGVFTELEWLYGIGLSVAASVVSVAAKLMIRKSWLLQQQHQQGTTTAIVPLPPRKHLSTEETVEMDCCDCDDESVDNERFCCEDYSDRGLSLVEFGSDDTILHVPYVATNAIPFYLPVLLRFFGMFGMVVLNPLSCVLAMNYARRLSRLLRGFGITTIL